MENLPQGVEVHGNNIRISFAFRGVRCKEPLKGLAVNKRNIKFAANKRSVILHEIATQTFNYADHFPDSKRALLFSNAPKLKTVHEALAEWLKIKAAKVSTITFESYKQKADKHIKLNFDERTLVTAVTKHDLENLIFVELHHLANKTIREIMIPLRYIFGDLVPASVDLPVLGVEPDPFLRDEIKRIDETATHKQQELNQFVFGCWSGLRLSELFALAWEDIDLENWTANVRRSVVRGDYRVPKTQGSVRTVELLYPAREILQRHKELSFMLAPVTVNVVQRDNKTVVSESVRFVFRNTLTGEPYLTDKRYRESFFEQHLKKAKVRYRGPSQSRHTFASQLLTSNAPKEWIALQMGHTSTAMIDKRYGKWLKEERPSMADFVSDLLGFGDKSEETESKLKGAKK